ALFSLGTGVHSECDENLTCEPEKKIRPNFRSIKLRRSIFCRRNFSQTNYFLDTFICYIFRLSGAFVTGQVVSDISIFFSFMCASSSFRCHLVDIVTFRTLVRYMKACAIKSKEVVLDPHTTSSRISTIFEPE
ncbi:unnamed protein product, partial [Lymnaea stagnalis]